MSLRPAHVFSLRDRQDRDLGKVAIERVESDLVFGRFTPGPDYPQVERLFSEYVEAANDQLLGTVAELDVRIGILALRLYQAGGAGVPAIYDVQIGDGVITFRTRPAAEGAPAHDTASLTSLPGTSARPQAPTG
jgi:hypothetical protein